MPFAIVKPNGAGDTISRLAANSIGADDDNIGKQRFYMKIGSYVLSPQIKPFDLTAEGDSFSDIRHLGFISGSFALSGWMVNKGVEFDELKSTTNNNNVQISLNFGRDSDTGSIRFVSFDALITGIQLQYQRTAPFIPITIQGVLTGSYDGTNVLLESTIAYSP